MAEGVENEDIMHALTQLTCDYMQCCDLGQTVPGADLAKRLRDQSESR